MQNAFFSETNYLLFGLFRFRSSKKIITKQLLRKSIRACSEEIEQYFNRAEFEHNIWGNLIKHGLLKRQHWGLPSGSSKSSKGKNLEENSNKFGTSLY